MTSADSIDSDSLQKLYAFSRSAKAVFDHFAQRQNNSVQTTIDRLQAALRGSGQDVSRRDIIELFKALERAGCGDFKIGRRGKPSRFEWSVGLVEVGRLAAGEHIKVESITQSSSEDVDATNKLPDLVEHRYRLRRNLELCLSFPPDLTPSEAGRVADFVRTLPLV